MQAPSFPESLLGQVRALPDVNAAEGSVTDDQTKLVGRDDKVISTHGAPSLAFSVNPKGDQRFNPLKLTAGDWPSGSDEIAIDTNVAASKGYKVGDTIGVERNGPIQRFRVAGIVKLSGVSTRQRDPLGVRPADPAEAPRARGEARPDSRAIEGRGADVEADRRDQAPVARVGTGARRLRRR